MTALNLETFNKFLISNGYDPATDWVLLNRRWAQAAGITVPPELQDRVKLVDSDLIQVAMGVEASKIGELWETLSTCSRQLHPPELCSPPPP